MLPVMFRNFLSLAILFLSLTVTLFAQDSSSVPYTGYVEPKLKSVPKVNYPSEAFLTGIEGDVSVPVSISADGIVLEVKEPSGPGGVCDGVQRADVVAMRSLAKRAAQDAVYDPATIDGKAVQSAAVLVFNFLAPDGAKKNPETTQPSTVIPFVYLGTTDDQSKTDRSKFDPKNIPDTVSGGVLNGKAKFLAKPKYPAAAKALRAEGNVSIKVLTDTDGAMFSATAVSGHPLLRRTSEIAACNSKFAPTLVSGKPVKVSGIITYNFVP